MSHRAPPGLGEGKPWLIREIAWKERRPDSAELSDMSAMVCNGSSVDPQLHGVYWSARHQAELAIGACRSVGIPGPEGFVLIDINNKLVGGGCFDPADGPDEIAWLTCWFLEYRRWKTALAVPETVPVPQASKMSLQLRDAAGSFGLLADDPT